MTGKEYSPDYFHLLRIVLRIDKKDGAPDLTAIVPLDAEARKRGQRILFTVEDAAKDFYEFYDKFFNKPLARDLEFRFGSATYLQRTNKYATKKALRTQVLLLT